MQNLTYIKNKCFVTWMGFGVAVLNPKCVVVLKETCLDCDPSKIEKAVVKLLYDAPELSEKQVRFIDRYERSFKRNFVFNGKIVDKDKYVQIYANIL